MEDAGSHSRMHRRVGRFGRWISATAPMLLAILWWPTTVSASESESEAVKPSGNRPERVEWFRDLGLGMFIHWSFDSQLGAVISHSMVGASPEYLDRFIHELPTTFYPEQFDPDAWARLAKVAGFQYVVFTTKHHSGFCMWDTATTEFNITQTPFRRDIVKEVVRAFRRHGIAVGFYFSPEDFWLLHRQGREVARRRDYAQPSNNPGLMAHNLAQIRELLTRYGPVDVLFLDGEPDGVKQLAWSLQPEIVVTRGEMETPEQQTPNRPLPGPWEACYTLGTQWHFKPTHEEYKSGTQLIEMLIEIRAKGGNFLLNVGPQPDGQIPFEQERRIRELALWMFVNGEAITDVRPWPVIREGDIWFTRDKSANTVYAFLTRIPKWPKGERKKFILRSVRATPQTRVDVLGQSGRVVEYQPRAEAEARWEQKEDALYLSVVRAQRLYNNTQWPNPVVLRITRVQPIREASAPE